MKLKKLGWKNILVIAIILVAVILMCVCYVITQGSGNYIRYIRTHLTSISTNSSLPTNGKDSIIFYRDDCLHCKEVIPKAFVNNKVHNRNIQYRDVANHPKNYVMSEKLHVNTVPTKVKIIIRNGKVIHKQFSHNLE